MKMSSVMRMVIGQIEPVTEEKKRRIIEFARSITHGETKMSAIARPDLAWAVQVEYEVKLNMELDFSQTECNDPMAFLTSFCTTIGPGVYFCRGFENEVAQIYDPSPDLVNSQDRLLYGLPIVIEIASNAEPVVEFPLDWLNEFCQNGYTQPFKVDDDLCNPKNVLRQVFSNLCSFLATKGEWTYRMGYRPMAAPKRFQLA